MAGWSLKNWHAKEYIWRWLAATGTGALRMLPAEMAHDIGIWALRKGYVNWLLRPALNLPLSGLKCRVPGIGDLPHPIGLAAGFDKNCLAPSGFAKMGFSFLELGTVTPLPQSGNPKPRMFRYPEQMAIINRMGFNSDGASLVSKRCRELKWSHDRVPLGINVGKNKSTPAENAVVDFVKSLQAFDGLGRYYVVNVSSPNTPGLRDLATPEFLESLAGELGQKISEVWIKVDPDMNREKLQKLVEKISERGFQGIVLTNTHSVNWPEKGGMSGHPLSVKSNQALVWAHEVHRGELPVVACGGVLGGVDVLERITRGALAVQIYTALVYRGPWAVFELLVELQAAMKQRGFASLEEARGSYYLEN